MASKDVFHVQLKQVLVTNTRMGRLETKLNSVFIKKRAYEIIIE
jgi:hypothetical protein